MNKILDINQPLGADFDQVLHDTSWDFYSDSSTESVIPKSTEKTQFKSLVWSENFKPNNVCSYDHCIAATPFGKFIISWKSWAEYPRFSIDRAPGYDPYARYFSLEEAKQECAEHWLKTLNNCLRD